MSHIINLHAQSEAWEQKFFDKISWIRENSRDRNKNNYLNLDKEYKKYDIFHLLVQEEKIVGFSAVQSFSFPAGHVRLLSRTFYDPAIRRINLEKATKASFASNFMLGPQIEHARRQGKSVAFISVEFPRRRRFLQEWLRYINASGTFGQWILSAQMHLVCPAPESPNCWQNVAYLPLQEGATLELEGISLAEWRSRYGKK